MSTCSYNFGGPDMDPARAWALWLAAAILVAVVVALLCALTLGGCTARGADLAPVIAWTVDVSQYQPREITLRRGETAILEPSFLQGADALSLTDATNVVLRYKHTSWTTTAVVTGYVYAATSGVARVRWTEGSTNQVYRYEIAVISSNATLLRAFGNLKIEAGLTD